MDAVDFIEALAAQGRPGPGFFNPYAEDMQNADLEVPNAAKVRRTNLANYLRAFDRPKALLVGEAPGPHGAHWSGVAFTSERQIVNGLVPFKGRRTSRMGEAVHENSAQQMWALTRNMHPDVCLWNSVPWHPYDPDVGPFSIRAPTRKEQERFAPLLRLFIQELKPHSVIAVGRKAQDILGRLDVPCKAVRHPSFGGVPEFRSGLSKLLGIKVVDHVELT